MTTDSGRTARRVRTTFAWVVGVVGVVTTAVSLFPALPTIAAIGSEAVGPALILVAQAMGCLATPVLVAMAIADVGRRWWAWLIAAALLIMLLLGARTMTGTLGVYWLAG